MQYNGHFEPQVALAEAWVPCNQPWTELYDDSYQRGKSNCINALDWPHYTSTGHLAAASERCCKGRSLGPRSLAPNLGLGCTTIRTNEANLIALMHVIEHIRPQPYTMQQPLSDAIGRAVLPACAWASQGNAPPL
jgi:hypothetical protein